jgi:hypothetical protein
MDMTVYTGLPTRTADAKIAGLQTFADNPKTMNATQLQE